MSKSLISAIYKCTSRVNNVGFAESQHIENSDMWAAPAYIPEDSTITLTTPNSNNHSSPIILTPSPHSNHMIMGHQYPNYTHVLTSPLTLSPIRTHTQHHIDLNDTHIISRHTVNVTPQNDTQTLNLYNT